MLHITTVPEGSARGNRVGLHQLAVQLTDRHLQTEKTVPWHVRRSEKIS